MKLQLLLPRVEPEKLEEPKVCPYEGCGGKRVRWHQDVKKALRDTKYEQVPAQRYQCLKCKRTFRVYPPGVSRAQTSLRGKGLAVMLYLLGLSYGATSIALEAIGVSYCKSQVYYAVQEAASRVPGLKREQVFEGLRTVAMGADLTSVKCQGKWLSLGLTVDSISGLVLTVDQLDGQDIKALQKWIEPIAQQVGAQVLVTDDADAFKTVADETGMQHQVCKSHVIRSTQALVAELEPVVKQDADGSLAAIGVSAEQAVADLHRLEALVKSRKREEALELESLHRRYLQATPPQKHEQQSLAYRLRLLYLDRWNLWYRLTRYRTWKGPKEEQLDGTNNACERAIGWWIKERFRPMRGYKVVQNALSVSRLLAWAGNGLQRGGADLALLLS